MSLNIMTVENNKTTSVYWRIHSRILCTILVITSVIKCGGMNDMKDANFHIYYLLDERLI